MCDLLNGMMDGTEEEKSGLMEPWKSTYQRLNRALNKICLDKWIPVDQLDESFADERGDVWTLGSDGKVTIRGAERVISGWDKHIVAFQPTGLTRPTPPEQESE